MPLLLVLGRQRQANVCKFEASLAYRILGKPGVYTEF